MSQAKSDYTLFLMTCPPYSGATPQEGLDALLAFAAFNQAVKVLFIGDGGLQLINRQLPQEEKSIAKMISAFEIYDIEEVYVHLASLEHRGLKLEDLIGQPYALNSNQVSSLINGATQVMSF